MTPPSATTIEPAAPPSQTPPRRKLLRVAVQLLGFIAGLASLGWCVSLALKPENKEQFAKLSQAPAKLILAMLGLSLLTLTINGTLFWISLRPARRLRYPDVWATNAVSTFLGYLPMKAGAIIRVLVHNRRDRIPLVMIGSWFAAMAVVMFAAFTPPVLAVIWRGRIDATWLAAVVIAELLVAAAIVALAGIFRGPRGQARLESLVSALRLGFVRPLLRSRLWANLHAGFDMLASPVAVGGSVLLRTLDVGVQSLRLIVAAKIFGLVLPMGQAIPLALTFFLVGILSPSGLAGLREGAANKVAGPLLAAAGMAASGDDIQTKYAAVFLLVTATEAIVYLGSAALGIAWLRPDKLLKLRRELAPTSAQPASAPRPPQA